MTPTATPARNRATTTLPAYSANNAPQSFTTAPWLPAEHLAPWLAASPAGRRSPIRRRPSQPNRVLGGRWEQTSSSCPSEPAVIRSRHSSAAALDATPDIAYRDRRG